MNFEFTNQAIDFIQQALSQHDSKSYRILMDYVDGNSPYNDDPVGCHCNVMGKYRLLIVADNDPKVPFDLYSSKFETNFAPIYLNPLYDMMFDHQHKIAFDPAYPALTLSSDAGQITPKLPLIVALPIS